MPSPKCLPTPWWLVPNLLAVDAPVVAAVWQRFLATRHGIAVPVAAAVALGAAVWSIYLSDRWLDARRGALDADRHRAAADWPAAFAVAALAAGCLALASASQLPIVYIRRGLEIGAGVAAYLALVHAFARKFDSLPGSKELLVAVGFAAGVALPLFAEGVPCREWLPDAVGFAGLCALNCRLIDRWEATRVAAQSFLAEGSLGMLLVAASPFLPPAIGWAMAISVAGLLAIHLCCRASPRPARVLADVVLLSPLLCWCLP